MTDLSIATNFVDDYFISRRLAHSIKYLRLASPTSLFARIVCKNATGKSYTAALDFSIMLTFNTDCK